MQLISTGNATRSKDGGVLKTGVDILPDHRRQGIASALMQMLLEKAKALRLDTVTLSASEMGRGIYEKLGFTVKESHFTEMEWFPA